MVTKPGSIIGGVLLVAGSCIGAGMLALPIMTGLSGFFPSIAMFLLAWGFMTLTALLLIEVNGWFPAQVNIVSMAGHSFGLMGRSLSWTLYLFLFYSLLVAYIAGSGSLFASFFKSFFSWNPPVWLGSFFFVIIFAGVVYAGTRPVDLWNRLLMFGKIFCYLAMVFLGVRYIQPKLLAYTHSSYAVFSLPVLVIAFGFHNMIPTLTGYMNGDLKRVRKVVLGGSFFALFIYLVWEALVLGIVPLEGKSGIRESLRLDQEASQALAGVLGASWVSTFAQGLAFFAILTSFLAQALSLVHFLADGLKIPYKKRENPWLCCLALIPPLGFSLLFPQLFYKALNFAGGFCAVILFGVLPVAMVWMGRYIKNTPTPYRLMGGKPLLLIILLFSCFILFFQISSMFGITYLT